MARDLQKMADILRSYLADGDRITGIRVLSSGHSNETFFLEGLDRVLRMPPSEGGLLPPYDMGKQHRVLDAVYRMDPKLPVPRVYELCEDESVLGDAFFIMEAISGEDYEYAVPDWLAEAPESQRTFMSSQWIEAVANLHCNPGEGFPAERIDPRQYATICLNMATNAGGDARLIALLETLVKNPLPESGPPTPVHGDPKQGNTMWRKDGTLVALLDWEMSFVGEPLHDLGWMLCLYGQQLASAGLDLPGWLQQPQIVERWEARTGRSAAAIERYKLLSFAKIAAINSHGMWLYNSGRTKDPRYAAWGQGMPILLDILFRRAEKAL